MKRVRPDTSLYRQLTQLGVACEAIAPSLVPVKSGDRVKTDRRDAENWARCYRAGELTAVWIPDAAHEALRDLVRAREAAKKDQLHYRHWLVFCCVTASGPTGAGEPWTKKYLNWIRIQPQGVWISRRWKPRWRITSEKWNIRRNVADCEAEQAIDESSGEGASR